MRAIDLTDHVFGSLTAKVARTVDQKRGWDCLCSCGDSKWVPTFQLTSGNVVTCGNPIHRQSIKTGDRFGKLSVVEIHKDLKNRRYLATCLCDCGRTKTTSFRNLQRGCTTHCGCVPTITNKGLPEGESCRNSLIQSYKSNARSKGLPFTLTSDKCVSLFQGACFFCGQPPSEVFTKKNHKGSYTYSGIDRIDSSQGYTPENVVSCCTACNFLKGNRSNEQFLRHIQKIYKHHCT